MRSATHLFAQLCDADHLDGAAALTVRGKRRRPDVAWFLYRRERQLAEIRRALAAGTWRPEPFEILFIRDPKPRTISRATIEDRVVHTALVELMGPLFMRSLLDDAFACRPGFGTHRAVLRLHRLMQRHRFAVHLDIRSYFASVDVTTLRSLLCRRVRDARFLAVVDHLLAAGAEVYRCPVVRAYSGLTKAWPPPGRGLPIGTLTSQLFAAHVYLNGLDHHVKRDLKVPGYARYVDDLLLFGNRRCDLLRWRSEVADWLRRERGLRLKHPNARILACAGHLDALGHRIRRDDIRPLPRALRRMKARVAREMRRPTDGWPKVDIRRSVASTAAMMLT